MRTKSGFRSFFPHLLSWVLICHTAAVFRWVAALSAWRHPIASHCIFCSEGLFDEDNRVLPANHQSHWSEWRFSSMATGAQSRALGTATATVQSTISRGDGSVVQMEKWLTTSLQLWQRDSVLLSWSLLSQLILSHSWAPPISPFVLEGPLWDAWEHAAPLLNSMCLWFSWLL